MLKQNKPKFTAIVARGYNGIEQVTVQGETNDPAELREIVNTLAASFEGRTAHYVAEQEKYEKLIQKQDDVMKAEEATVGAGKSTNKRNK